MKWNIKELIRPVQTDDVNREEGVVLRTVKILD
jgi:hypothetical protein